MRLGRGLSSQKEHGADEEGEEEDVACRGAERLVELAAFGLLQLAVRHREDDDVGQHEEHPPEAIDRVKEAHREQPAGEVEAWREVTAHPHDERALASLAVFVDVAIVIHDEDIHARQTDRRS